MMNNKTSEPTPASSPSDPAIQAATTAEDVLRKSLSARSRRRGRHAAQSDDASEQNAIAASAPVANDASAHNVPVPDIYPLPVVDTLSDTSGVSHVTDANAEIITDANVENLTDADGEDSPAPEESVPTAPHYSRHLLSDEERRARVKTSQRALPLPQIPTSLVAVGMLLIGVLCGALLMRQRHAAQEVVLSVNGSLLKQDEINRRIQSASAPPIARKWVQEEMWLQFARQKHALPTPAEVDAHYARLTKDPEFAAAQQTNPKSPEEIKRALQVQLAQTALLSGNAQADEADARAFYAQNSDPHNPDARYFVPETLEAQILVTRTQQAGQQALQRFQRGENFDVLVHELSVDVSRQQGGAVTITRHRGRYTAIPDMESTLFNLEKGGMAGPQKFAGYWWIIRCNDKKPEHVIPYVQVAEDCRLGARLQKGVPHTLQQVQTEFAAFQQSARVEAFWPQVVSEPGKP